MGKGSKKRKSQVSYKKLSDNWDKVFSGGGKVTHSTPSSVELSKKIKVK